MNLAKRYVEVEVDAKSNTYRTINGDTLLKSQNPCGNDR